MLVAVRRRPLPVLCAVVALGLAVGAAGGMWGSLPLAESQVVAAEQQRDELFARADRYPPPELRVLQASRERDVADAKELLDSWRRFAGMSSLLTLIALMTLAGLLRTRVQRLLPSAPLVVLGAGVVGLLDRISAGVPANDAGSEWLYTLLFAVALLLLTYATVADQHMTADERHDELLRALEDDRAASVPVVADDARRTRPGAPPAVTTRLDDVRDPVSALELFDSLPAVTVAELCGRWTGRGVPTGHPFDGLLERLGWHGKVMWSPRAVHPLVVCSGSGRKIAVAPGRLPLGAALRLAPVVPGAAVAAVFRAVLPLLTTSRPQARLLTVEHRGVVTGAMTYDRLPVVDVFRRYDERTLLGVMEVRDDPRPYVFVLEREHPGP